MNIHVRRIKKEILSEELFADFNRHQEVTRVFRASGGKWVLEDAAFTEEWNENEKKELVQCLANTLATGGIIYGTFDEKRLVGFVSVESKRFGSDRQYVELSSIHVDSLYRNRGLGKRLFNCAISCAESLNAKKLYISAHSSVETQAFYRKMGCVEAIEFNSESLEKEPCDCQLEYVLPHAGGSFNHFMPMGICLGLLFGITILDNPALGMCLGMAAGVLFGTYRDTAERKHDSASTSSFSGQPVVEGGPTAHDDNVGCNKGGAL